VHAGDLPLCHLVGVAHVDHVERGITVEPWRKFSGANEGNKVSSHDESVGAGRPRWGPATSGKGSNNGRFGECRR
jgi:hypothetical protein